MNHPTITVKHNFDADANQPTSYTTNSVPPVPHNLLIAACNATTVKGTLVYYQSYDAMYIGIDVDGDPAHYHALAFCGDDVNWQLA